MFGLGVPEIIVIILAIGILLFGGKKITELSRSMGRASGEFKKGKQEIERELKEEADKMKEMADGGEVKSDMDKKATAETEGKM